MKTKILALIFAVILCFSTRTVFAATDMVNYPKSNVVELDYEDGYYDYDYDYDYNYDYDYDNTDDGSDSDSEEKDKGFETNDLLYGCGVGIVLAFIIVGIMALSMKSVHMQSGANDYVVPGSMKLQTSRDLFLYRKVNRVKRETNKK